jgi:hypothetical protein
MNKTPYKYPFQPLPECVLWYDMQDSGNKILDRSGYEHHGTNVGSIRILGLRQFVRNFDGDDRIGITASPKLALGAASSWSFEAIVKVTGKADLYENCVIFANGGVGWIKGISLCGWAGGAGDNYWKPTIGVQSGVTDEGFTAQSNVDILGTGYKHLIGIFDRRIAGQEKLSVYMNGARIAYNQSPPAWLNGFDLTGSNNNWRIGAGGSIGTDKRLNGAVGLVRVYKGIISPVQALAIFREIAPQYGIVS